MQLELGFDLLAYAFLALDPPLFIPSNSFSFFPFKKDP
jgi:hypothetical protein